MLVSGAPLVLEESWLRAEAQEAPADAFPALPAEKMNFAQGPRQGCRVARRNLAKMRDVLMDQDLLPDYFQVGDEVMLFTPKVRTSSQIFRNAWSGPYRIQRAHSKVVMDLVHTQKPTDQRLAHVSRLKRKL